MDIKRKIEKLFVPEGGRFTGQMLIALILPLVAEQFLAIMVGIADTVMVNATGENAVSAVSLVDTLNVLLIQVFSAMGGGGSVVAAQYLGRGDRREACAAGKQLLISSLAISLVIALPCIFLRSNILNALYGGVEDDIMRQAETYFLLSALSYPVLALYNGGVGLLRAMGNSRTSMYSSVIMNVINIAGNAVLIYGFKMGVAGAGIASLVSRAVSAFIILRLLLKPTWPIHIEDPLDLKPDMKMIKRITAIGVPNGLENSLFQVGKLIIARILATLPFALIAANAVTNSISGCVNIPGSAVALASLTVIGQCAGAGDDIQAKAYGKRLTLMMLLVELPTNILLFLFPGLIAGVFTLSPEAMSATVGLLRGYGIVCIFLWTPSFGLPSVLRAAGDVRFSMIVSMVSMLALRLGCSYLFVYVFGWSLTGIWSAMYCDWAARSAMFLLRFRSGKWLEHKVI